MYSWKLTPLGINEGFYVMMSLWLFVSRGIIKVK